MIAWLAGLYAVCLGGLGFVFLQALRDASESYSQVYTRDTARRFEELFLFVPPERILAIARVGAAAVFVLAFLLAGHFREPAGALRGAAAGALFGTLALFAPGALLRVLKIRRRERFDEQLPDALMTMSNALRAGFSILQAFDSIVRESRGPIAQEFGMLQQQVRVGVPFDEALNDLDRRVQSEDLTLMVLAIDTARQTGGSLTEVLDRIADTIRERQRIRGRIRSLTAQGRMQGIVVGLMPILLFAAMSFFEPGLMIAFTRSPSGLSVLAFAALLEIAGYLLIRKIVRIEI
jgi:tight adherence protein B